MLDVDRITDFDQLKQVTRLLHKENQRLHQKLVQTHFAHRVSIAPNLVIVKVVAE